MESNGICPYCGFEKEHVADQYCDLCTLARRQETIQKIVLRAYKNRPENEDAIRGIR